MPTASGQHTLVVDREPMACERVFLDETQARLAREVAERRHLETQLRHAQKLQSMGELAAGIAHEINTPTQFIGDNIRFLKDACGDLLRLPGALERLLQAVEAENVTPALLDEVRSAVEAADLTYLRTEIPRAIAQSLDGVERISGITRAMKEFSHPGATEPTPVDLNRAIATTLTVCRNEWRYVADVVTELDPGLPPVAVVPGEFNQVILNLVVNAAHAIGETLRDDRRMKGTITVSTRQVGGRVEVRIADTGTGIPVDVRPRIFDPFFTTKPPGRGTGQGLAIAHAVVVGKHGGTLTFETEIGRGTTFVIGLPLAPAAAAESAA